MNPLLISPALIAVIVAVSSAVSFGAGWAVESWHKGAEVEKLRGDNVILSSTNSRCEADIRNARAAVRAIQAEAKDRARIAEEAMRQTEPEVKQRTVTITKIKEMPVVALNMQCEAIEQEQAEYVAWRKQL